ncbi:endonuclease/exonuclease/phosphatase family protein [Streptococcus suis]|uniref:Endonuclease/exonuclease/phosphatase domain-containing protein n=1 Tax=Streptococcus suis TaxID=1307 RepID=A0AAD0PAI3_STRSU|nr:endonuclease/exonuclease/phosphatase family protein [Streptococcus suis]AWX94975.1 hypothetical protein BKM66_01980 [Streptococcus suis]AWX96868.1 hypothetical protein BKM67_01985 [Streptococcus suis]MBS8056840.1 endonuclease/exonuclease/phosphatase family protein [Streptococcus suis]MCL4942964.1 hypothetical protein [Streptococcus suis]WNN03069.1 hypothetical protein RMQ63_07510 [Streptococcus suis]
MKIVSWNCNGSFRTKYKKFFSEVQADVYIIQECEDLGFFNQIDFPRFCSSKRVGHSKSKGLAVFSHLPLKFEDAPNHYLQHFIPFVLDGYRIFAVWAMKPYIEQMLIYFSIYEYLLNSSTIIIGDFNSNVIWDKRHKEKNHSTLNNVLLKHGLQSAYHFYSRERFGEEREATFYMYRNNEKPYHIDYVYASPNILKNFKILSYSDWIDISDHVPLLVEFSI